MKNQASRFLLTITLCFCALLSCEKNDVSVRIPIKGDYFPLQKGNEWEYVRTETIRCNCSDSGRVLIDTLKVYIDRIFDFNNGTLTSANNLKETPFTLLLDRGIADKKNFYFSRLARKQGSRYTDLPPYRLESLFLVDDKPINYSWVEYEGFIVLTVKQVNGILNVKNNAYKNVIEIQEDGKVYTTHHYYARGIGEIYSIQLFKGANSEYSNRSMIELSLIKHFKP
jgi:hypothetical protein